MKKKTFVLFLFFIICSCNTTSNITKTGDTSQSQQQPYDDIAVSDLKNNQEGDKLSVALLLPLSGKAEKVGQIMLKAAQLSMFNNKLNNIVIMPYDTKGTAFGAVEAINAAIRDNADVVLGPLFTQSTKAILDIAEMNNLILISFSDNQNLIDTKHNNLYLMGLTLIMPCISER